MKKHSLIVPASVNFGMTIYSNLAGVKGLEPSAFRVTGGRSNQLSYTPMVLVEDTGIEPATS